MRDDREGATHPCGVVWALCNSEAPPGVAELGSALNIGKYS
jgi:hypothetical protein